MDRRYHTGARRAVYAIIVVCILSGCSAKSSICPRFPDPPQSVADKLDTMAGQDPDVKAWGNALLRLREKLEECR